MNFWTAVFVLANTLLCIRLLFFSDQDRQVSRWGYRLLLFLVAIHVGKQVINFIFSPHEHVQALEALFYVGVFLGALLMRPEYLPGNCPYADTKRAYRELGCTVTRTWFWFWHSQLYGSEAKPRSTGH